MLRPAYPPDLTDAQWAILQPSIPPLKPGGRPGSHARASSAWPSAGSTSASRRRFPRPLAGTRRWPASPGPGLGRCQEPTRRNVRRLSGPAPTVGGGANLWLGGATPAPEQGSGGAAREALGSLRRISTTRQPGTSPPRSMHPARISPANSRTRFIDASCCAVILQSGSRWFGSPTTRRPLHHAPYAQEVPPFRLRHWPLCPLRASAADASPDGCGNDIH